MGWRLKKSKQEDPKALDCSAESRHMRRWCIGLWLKRYHLKNISILSSGGHGVQPILKFWSTLVEGIMRNISVKLFWIRRRCGLKIFLLELWRPLYLAEWNHLCNFSRGYHEVHFCEIILNLDQWFRRCRLKYFLSGALAALLFWRSQTFCAILAAGIKGEQSCEIFLNLDQWLRKRCHLKKKFTDAWRRRITIAHLEKTDHNSSPWAFGSGELKKQIVWVYQYQSHNWPLALFFYSNNWQSSALSFGEHRSWSRSKLFAKDKSCCLPWSYCRIPIFLPMVLATEETYMYFK